MKSDIRKRMLKRRDALSEDERIELSSRIADLLFKQPVIIRARTIAFYLPKGSEVRTEEMIERAVKEDKEVLVPVTNDEITMVRFLGFDKLQNGRFGILEPVEKIKGNEPDVVIVPGVAFGLCMHRIGYGKGYYDKYLKTTKAYRIGICYDFQVIEKLPNHTHDEPMDLIITDKRTIAPQAETGDD
ncbi:MAG: 5-formyltetrahydrofolate cyclo-ligase [Candidatus Bilamarchaeaceae archaeon]